ncbi:hypothetical protein KCP77_14635 [Salmonella enterica subsp. enterica]|nr:hypothetical protein KCP77_14635 [Salmonella enterica subsp. enterica]
MRYVELMKENFALTCCRNRASRTANSGQELKHRKQVPVSIPEATTSLAKRLSASAPLATIGAKARPLAVVA